MVDDIQRFDQSKPYNNTKKATVFVSPTGFATVEETTFQNDIVNSGLLDQRFDDVLYYVSG